MLGWKQNCDAMNFLLEIGLLNVVPLGELLLDIYIELHCYGGQKAPFHTVQSVLLQL